MLPFNASLNIVIFCMLRGQHAHSAPLQIKSSKRQQPPQRSTKQPLTKTSDFI